MRPKILTASLIVLSLSMLPLASCGVAPAGGKTAINSERALTIKDYGTFDEPWAMAFLPGGHSALITERSGKLWCWDDNGK